MNLKKLLQNPPSPAQESPGYKISKYRYCGTCKDHCQEITFDHDSSWTLHFSALNIVNVKGGSSQSTPRRYVDPVSYDYYSNLFGVLGNVNGDMISGVRGQQYIVSGKGLRLEIDITSLNVTGFINNAPKRSENFKPFLAMTSFASPVGQFLIQLLVKKITENKLKENNFHLYKPSNNPQLNAAIKSIFYLEFMTLAWGALSKIFFYI